MMVSLDTINTLAGICLIMFGRQLYWLFVGLVVLLYGLLAVPQLLLGRPGWMVVAAALGSGALAGLLAVFFKRIVMAVAGFLAGGFFAFSLAHYFHLTAEHAPWIAGAIAGALCAVLFAVFFDWSIIILSSLIGSLLITQSLHEGVAASVIIFTALSIAGVVAQAAVMHKATAK
ncbi:MAG: hypothetical protein ACOX2W_13275 [Desulfomonilia bacterium]